MRDKKSKNTDRIVIVEIAIEAQGFKRKKYSQEKLKLPQEKK